MIVSLEAEILRFLSEPLEDKFEPLALKIFDYQRRENLPYARYCEFLGTPHNRLLEEDPKRAPAGVQTFRTPIFPRRTDRCGVPNQRHNRGRPRQTLFRVVAIVRGCRPTRLGFLSAAQAEFHLS